MATCIWTGASSGDWSTAGNWTGGVPGAGDTAFFSNNAVSVTSGLDQHTVALSALIIEQSYTGAIGTASAYLRVDVDDIYIGQHYGSGTPSGSGRIKLQLEGACASLNVYNSATTATDTYLAPIQICSNSQTITTARITKGRVGFAIGSPSETITITTLVQSYESSVNSDAVVQLGAGATVATISKTGGALYHRGLSTDIRNDAGELDLATTDNITSLTVSGGTVTAENIGTITTYTITGGTVYLDRHGTITTANCYGGVTDWLRSLDARTCTTVNSTTGATLRYDPSIVTFTNKLAPSGRVSVQVQAA